SDGTGWRSDRGLGERSRAHSGGRAVRDAHAGRNRLGLRGAASAGRIRGSRERGAGSRSEHPAPRSLLPAPVFIPPRTRSVRTPGFRTERDRKSTRLNSSHVAISYAVFCLKKKKGTKPHPAAATQHSTSHPVRTPVIY